MRNGKKKTERRKKERPEMKDKRKKTKSYQRKDEI